MSAFTNSFSAMNDFRSHRGLPPFFHHETYCAWGFSSDALPVSGDSLSVGKSTGKTPSICAMGPSGFKWLAKIFFTSGAAPLAEDLPGFLLMYS